METLTDMLGASRIQELKREALASYVYGVRISEMSGDEQLAVIGIIAKFWEDFYLKGPARNIITQPETG